LTLTNFSRNVGFSLSYG